MHTDLQSGTQEIHKYDLEINDINNSFYRSKPLNAVFTSRRQFNKDQIVHKRCGGHLE